MGDVASRIDLCATDDVAPGAVLKVEAAGLSLAVFNVDGEFYVTDDACTHGPGSLSEGYLDGHVIECDFHNGAFDVRTGEVVAPPCMIPLKTYTCRGRRRPGADRAVKPDFAPDEPGSIRGSRRLTPPQASAAARPAQPSMRARIRDSRPCRASSSANIVRTSGGSSA